MNSKDSTLVHPQISQVIFPGRYSLYLIVQRAGLG